MPNTIPLSMVLADAANELRSNEFEAMAAAVEMAIKIIEDDGRAKPEEVDGYLAIDKDESIGMVPSTKVEEAERSGIKAERRRWIQACSNVLQVPANPEFVAVGGETFNVADVSGINEAIRGEIVSRAERLAEIENA